MISHRRKERIERTNLMTIGRGVSFGTLRPTTTVDVLGKEERRKHKSNRLFLSSGNTEICPCRGEEGCGLWKLAAGRWVWKKKAVS